MSLHGGSHDGANDTYHSMLTTSQNSSRAGNSPSGIGFSTGVVYECIQKFFRYQCQKCKKTFKRKIPSEDSRCLGMITNEIANALVNIEETLNQQQSKPALI